MIVYRWDFLYLHLSKNQKMKSKITLLALAFVFIYSCKAKKEATTTTTVESVKVVEMFSPVEQSAETVALASGYDGKNLYENNCAKCHKLYKAEDFPKEEWVPILKDMQRKAKINDAETLAIFNYLTGNK